MENYAEKLNFCVCTCLLFNILKLFSMYGSSQILQSASLYTYGYHVSVVRILLIYSTVPIVSLFYIMYTPVV